MHDASFIKHFTLMRQCSQRCFTLGTADKIELKTSFDKAHSQHNDSHLVTLKSCGIIYMWHERLLSQPWILVENFVCNSFLLAHCHRGFILKRLSHSRREQLASVWRSFSALRSGADEFFAPQKAVLHFELTSITMTDRPRRTDEQVCICSSHL